MTVGAFIAAVQGSNRTAGLRKGHGARHEAELEAEATPCDRCVRCESSPDGSVGEE